MLVDELLVVIIDECLKTGIHIEILYHRGIDAIDVHLLCLTKMHTFAEHLPTCAVVKVSGRRININIVKEYSSTRFITSELFINSLAELAKHLASRTA